MEFTSKLNDIDLVLGSDIPLVPAICMWQFWLAWGNLDTLVGPSLMGAR